MPSKGPPSTSQTPTARPSRSGSPGRRPSPTRPRPPQPNSPQANTSRSRAPGPPTAATGPHPSPPASPPPAASRHPPATPDPAAPGQLTAERLNTRIDAAVMSTAQPASVSRLRAASAVVLCRPQMSCRPAPRLSTPYRSRARVWVVGRTRATAASQPGSAVIGNSDPARNQGKMATTGVRPTYSSWVGIRLARISATAYMNTVNSSTAPANQADRDGDGHVAEHDQAAGDGGGEQFAAGAAGPVDDHADACERAGERDEQADGADDDEGGVAAASGDHLGKCRGDDQGEQQRGDQRREDLARGVRTEHDPAPGQGGPRGHAARPRPGPGQCGLRWDGRNGGHRDSPFR